MVQEANGIRTRRNFNALREMCDHVDAFLGAAGIIGELRVLSWALLQDAGINE